MERANLAIFENGVPSAQKVVILSTLQLADYRTPIKLKKTRKRALCMVKEGSVGWFDGAATTTGNCCGAGGILKISEHRIIHWLINCGPGTNNRAELMGAWALLTLASRFPYRSSRLWGTQR
jgi:hypothetical protein